MQTESEAGVCVMPLYELFCLARPSLAKAELSELLKRSCSTVLSGNGVITKIDSNGVIPLCHTIKKTHGHYSEAYALQMRFHAGPSLLDDVHHGLSTDERVLRYQIMKYRDVPKIKQWRAVMQYGDSDQATKDIASIWTRPAGPAA